MKCPTCVAEGRTSTMTEYPIATTAMFVDRYHDEDGNIHYHDPNGRGSVLECSNGHVWDVTEGGSCRVPGCEFNHPKRIEPALHLEQE